MNIDIMGSALLGLTTAVLLYLWKRGSGRWAHWFPAIRKTAEVTLKVAIVGVVVLEVLIVFVKSDQPGVSLLSGVLGYGAFEAYSRFAKNRLFSKKDTLKRGTAVAPLEEVKRQVFQNVKKSAPPRLQIGALPVPRVAEPYHFGLMGSTGTGKSVTFNQMLQAVREEGDTAIIVDSGGGFIKKHFNEETDFIFNPYDDRCINWSPLYELKGPWDATALARSIIPDGVGDNKEWNGYAQTFLTSLMTKLNKDNRLELQDLLYYALAAPVSELQTYLAGTAAAGQMGSDKTFGSIRNILTNYLSPYANLPGKGGHMFSVVDMVQACHSGFLFMSYRDDQLDSVRDMFACMLDVIARSLLSLSEDKNRRIWLFIDEFASLGKVQSIENFAAKARKYGGCLVVGLQSIAQLRDRYGEHGAQTILSCLSTWLVLRTEDADTAEYLSRYIGDAEFNRMQKSVNQADSGSSQGAAEQQTTVKAVLASELQQMKTLNGYVRLSGGYPVCKVELDFSTVSPDRDDVPSFLVRDAITKPMLEYGHPSSQNQATPTPTAPANAPAQVAARQEAPSPAPAPAGRPIEIVAPTIHHRMPMEHPEEMPLLNTHVLLRRPAAD